MPWKECNRMNERLKFVARLLDVEKMSALCLEFSISRQTGYKIYNRYKNHGVDGLEDRSGDLIAMLTNSPFKSNALSCVSRRKDRLGVHPNPGETTPRIPHDKTASKEHRPCRVRPPRPGQASKTSAL